MSEKFKGKYRNESARLQNWDYGWNAAYFMTICTKDRLHFFGEIENGIMKLSHQGVIADLLWYEIKNHAENVELGEFVVMPNHIHGILIIDRDTNDVGTTTATTPNLGTTNDVGTTPNVGDTNDVGTTPIVGTGHALSLPHALSLQYQLQSSTQPPTPPTDKTIGQQRFQNQGKNTVSSIIGSYKSAVTKHCNRLDFDFAWQTRFHDHIIRNGESFHRISEYIKNNPNNWKEDKFY